MLACSWPLRALRCTGVIGPGLRARNHLAQPPRLLSSQKPFPEELETIEERNQRIALYMISVALSTLGVAYASVPLYKVFCQVRAL